MRNRLAETEKTSAMAWIYWLNGRGGEIRTHDLLYPKQARYQPTLRPDNQRDDEYVMRLPKGKLFIRQIVEMFRRPVAGRFCRWKWGGISASRSAGLVRSPALSRRWHFRPANKSCHRPQVV